jgi:hypothetical protein
MKAVWEIRKIIRDEFEEPAVRERSGCDCPCETRGEDEYDEHGVTLERRAITDSLPGQPGGVQSLG